MNKLFKLTGVSMLAIVAATGARAAGYTCEELIEYESCNEGYYYGYTVNGTDSQCPSGYTLYTNGFCWYHYEDVLSSATTPEECEEGDEELDYYEWISEPACVYAGGEYVEGEIETGSYTILESYSHTCVLCPVGSICAGGDVADAVAEPCPAGSYCATKGLSAVSGVCAVGSYSTGGATVCTSCPESDLKDSSGATVVTTTSGAGATSATACYIDKTIEFSDEKGIYQFRENCAHDGVGLYGQWYELNDGDCADGYVLSYNGEYCIYPYMPKETCFSGQEYSMYEMTWENGLCGCEEGGTLEVSGGTFSCE